MGAIAVHVVGVSGDAEALVEQLAAAGHTVSGPQPVELDGVASAIEQAPGADVVVVMGRVGPDSALPERIATVCTFVFPGYGEAARRLAAEVDGAGAVYQSALAGDTSTGRVYLVPDDPVLCARVVEALILPQLAHVPLLPGPTTQPAAKVGVLAQQTTESSSSSTEEPTSAEVPARGWVRAVHDLGAELFIGRREDLPEPIEKLAPVVNVLHTAGEFGVMKLPTGRRYSLFGWPDLRRPTSKVLAVSWGDPLAEVIALHRYPDQVGTMIPGKLGMLPSQDTPVERVCDEVVGREAPTAEGRPFAIDKNTVWILKERRVIKWDGKREREDGNAKQVLASLTLHWSSQ